MRCERRWVEIQFEEMVLKFNKEIYVMVFFLQKFRANQSQKEVATRVKGNQNQTWTSQIRETFSCG